MPLLTQNRSIFRLGALLVLGFVATACWAQSDSAENRLQQIRQALVEQATEAETRVSTISWLGHDGQLREFDRFSSDVKIQNLRFPSEEVAVEDAGTAVHGAKTQVVATDHCAALMAKASVRQVMAVRLDLSAQLSASQHLIAQMVGRKAISELVEMSQQFDHMELMTKPAYKEVYDRLSYGHGEENIKWTLVLTVSPDSIGQWSDETGYVLTWKVQGPVHGTPWQLSAETLYPSQFPSRGSVPRIDPAFAQAIHDNVEKLAAKLDHRLSCEPQAITLSTDRHGQWMLNAGLSSGLSVGDRLLVVDGRVLPAHTLEPQALDHAVLVEIKTLSEYQSTVAPMAGQKQRIQTSWVAWPYTY